jgi:HPt (histidine-containing phosphotransfer) domain-containing protein
MSPGRGPYEPRMDESTAPVLDLTYLMEAADGDAGFIAEILGDYLREMNKYLAEVEMCLEKHDLGLMVRAAHTMKGASANVGAARVRETASRLETQAKKGSLEGGASLVSILHQEVSRVRELVDRQGVENLMRA